MRHKRYLLIVNPNAGGPAPDIDGLTAYFAHNNARLNVVRTKKPMEAKSIAKKAVGKYTVVIAAGGDGTVNEVINGLAGSRTPLGIMPAGTENALAMGLGIPLDCKRAAEHIIKGKARTLDLGRVKKRYFILTAGVGLDAKAMSDVKPVLKKMLGRGIYPLTALRTILTHVPAKLEIWLDDQVLPRWGYFVVIGNVKYYGRNMHLAQMAEPDDGYLDVCIFKRTDVINMFKYFISAASKGFIPLKDFPNIEYFRVKKMKVRSSKKVLTHADAEIIGKTPVGIKVCPGAIRVVCDKD